MKKGYIYTLDNGDDNVFYVGATIKPEFRLVAHKTSMVYYDEVKKEHIRVCTDNVKMDIVEEILFKWKEELFEIEDYWIHQFKAWGFPIRNTTFRKKMNHYKIPVKILNYFKEFAPHINPYRTIEGDAFVNTLYTIIDYLENKKQPTIHDTY